VPISMEELIRLLNKDLSLEYTACIQYVQHSGVMTGAQYGDIIKELKIHASEELAHALTLAEYIDFFGGFPTVEMPTPETSAENDMMLRQDLAGELDAIKRYKIRIEQAEELKEFALAQALRQILGIEQEHAMDLKAALGE
jgi:bacterioferritin